MFHSVFTSKRACSKRVVNHVEAAAMSPASKKSGKTDAGLAFGFGLVDDEGADPLDDVDSSTTPDVVFLDFDVVFDVNVDLDLDLLGFCFCFCFFFCFAFLISS